MGHEIPYTASVAASHPHQSSWLPLLLLQEERSLLEQALTAAVNDTTTTTTNDDDNDDDSKNIASAILSNLFLFFLIFGLSATVDVKNMKRQLTNKFAIGCGVTMQFVIMPLLGFVAVSSMRHAPGMSEAMGIALLVVTSSPGGSYSNWWCSMFNADLALSVAMTTVSSILSIGLLPANLLLYTYLTYGVISHDDNTSRHESILQAIDFKSLFLTLGVVLAAILSGLLAGTYWDTPGFHVLANRFGSVSGFLLIVFSVFLSSGGDGSDAKFWNHSWSFYVLVAFPCLAGISLANVISRAVRLSPPETVAISIECCYQNTGIATSVAITMFSDKNERAEAVAVPLFYGLVEAVVIGCYCVMAWKWGWTKAPPDENICVVLAHTYEVEDEHDDHDDEEEDDKEDDGEQGEQDLSMFDEDYQNENTPEQHRPQHAEEHRRASQQPEVLAQGFWGRFFPPILQRTLSIFSSRSDQQPDLDESESGDFDSKDPYKLSLPKGSDDSDANRNRFVSADYTAETSLCSAMSSPTSPETPIREVDEMALQDGGVIFNIQSLTIPEVSPEHAEKDSDEEEEHEATLAPRTSDC